MWSTIFLISVKQRGFKFILNSLISVITMTLFLEILEFVPNPLDVSDDILLSALMTGVFAGVGLGMVLRAGATSGGTDMLASIVKFIKPHHDISKLLLIIDGIIIIFGISVFGVTNGIYAIIAVYISTLIINIFTEGAHFARGSFILSEGMYSTEDKEMLFVIVEPKEVVTLQNIVKNIDTKAFMVIFDVRQALGEGFFDFKELDKKL